MKLARLQKQIPPSRRTSISTSKVPREDKESSGIGEAQHASHDGLGMIEADEVDDGLSKSCQDYGANEGPGNGARKGEVVIGLRELLVDILQWCSVHEYIVGGLDVERLLDLGVRGDEKVEEDESWDEEGEPQICDGCERQCACRCANMDRPTYLEPILSSSFLFRIFTSCLKVLIVMRSRAPRLGCC